MTKAMRELIEGVKAEPFAYLACVAIVVGVFALAWFR